MGQKYLVDIIPLPLPAISKPGASQPDTVAFCMPEEPDSGFIPIYLFLHAVSARY
jgi:hypothetical protein